MQPFVLRAWLRSVVLLFCAWCPVSTAAAASSVLVLVRSLDQSDPAPYELRLRSEISTEGIVAIVVNPLSTSGDTQALAAKFGANTTVEVAVSANEVTAAIWTADTAMGLEVNRNVRVSTRERDAVAVFALRTVDFLQGARIELEQQRQSKMAADEATSVALPRGSEANGRASRSTATAQTKDSQGKAMPASSSVGGLGLSTLQAARGGRSAAVPLERLRFGAAFTVLRSSDRFLWSTAGRISLVWHWHPKWSLGVAATGPYLNYIRSSSDEYSVTVDQEFVALNLRRRITLGQSWELEPYLAMGGTRYSANASAKPPRFGYHATAWSLFSLGGASLVLRLGNHFRIVADVEIFGRWQTPSATVNGRDVTGSSPWNLVMALGPGWAI